MKIKSFFYPVFLVYCLFIFSGCSYLKNRGNDAMDIMDLGITVNDRIQPQIGLYIDFFNILPLGYSNVDGKIIGFGNRQAGWLDHADESWGLVFYGKEMKALGEFNPLDPHRTRKDQRELSQWPHYNVGLARMIFEDDIPPTAQFIECQRVFHFGWIGFIAHLRPIDLVDFILGWSTLDIVGDDNIRR